MLCVFAEHSQPHIIASEPQRQMLPLRLRAVLAVQTSVAILQLVCTADPKKYFAERHLKLFLAPGAARNQFIMVL